MSNRIPTPGHEDDEHITATEAMGLLCYTDRKSFWRMAKQKGMPMRRLNARVILIPRAKFRDWLSEFDAA